MKQAHVMRLGVVICTFLAAAAGMAVGEEMDPVDYCKVRELRTKLWLTNDNLAAVGCNQAKAEAVLSALKGWYETNKAEYLRRCKARDDAEEALREANRKIYAGGADGQVGSQIPTLQANVAAALESWLELLEAAKTQVLARLSDEEKTRLETIRSNVGLPRNWKYAPNLTAEQQTQLRRAHQTYVRNTAGARTAEALSAAASALQNAESQVLTYAQKEAIEAADARLRANMAGVLAAEKNILRVPAALRNATAAAD
jgi:hypothetical protein